MRIQVLGPLSVTEGRKPYALGGPKQRLVLALLAAEAGETVSIGRLIDGVWESAAPATARKTLQGYIHHLRGVVGDAIVTDQAGYRLDHSGIEIDAIEFEQMVGGSADDPDEGPRERSQRLATALAMWTGSPYADLDGALALEPEIVRLRELRLNALEQRIDADVELGAASQLIGELESLTLEYPLRERFHGQLMRALYLSGRQVEALRAFERAHRVLAEEVGLDVPPRLRRLEAQILEHDPALTPAAPEGEPPAPNAIRGYELRGIVAEGPHGRIHRGYQTSVEREVAIKVIEGDLANDSRFIAEFTGGSSGLAHLVHPHIIPVTDMWREPGRAFTVSPWLDGGSLGERPRRPGALSPTAIDQIASALAYAHRQGIAHGSVTPRQIIFDTDGNAYLTRFQFDHDHRDDEHRYDAPERLNGAPPTPAADIYSFATIVADYAGPGLDEAWPAQSVIAKARDPRPPRRHERVDDFVRELRRAVGGDVASLAGASAAELTVVRNPYKGLRAFLESDADDFFGRDELVITLRRVLDERRLVAVVGASGSGKSSAVRAGLIPTLRRERGPDDPPLLIAEMYPGSYPFEELAATLLRVAVDQSERMLEDLTADDRGLLRISKAILPDDDSELLLVIDQFEELYAMVGDDATRRLFIDNLVTATTDPRSRISIVLTLRADFFDRPLEHSVFAGLVDDGLVMVPPLAHDSVARAIAGPARAVGLDLEPGLVTQIAADVEGQPGALPLMQYALTAMVDSRTSATLTLDGYHEIGGVSGALGVRAEALYQGLGAEGREAVRQCFLRLVSIHEDSDIRRRVRRSELTTLTVDQRALGEAVRLFGAARLLSFDRDPHTRGPTVEVAHEALLREWPRLRSWLEAQHDDLVHHRTLAAAVDEWALAGRDDSYLLRGGRLDQFDDWATYTSIVLSGPEREFLEASRTQRVHEEAEELATSRSLRRRLVGVSVLAIVALGAGLLAAIQARRAGIEARQAQAAEADAETRRLVAEAPRFVESNRQIALLLAAEAYRRDPGSRSIGALQQVLVQTHGFRGYAGVGEPVRGLSFRTGGDIVALNDDAIRVIRPGEPKAMAEIPVAGATLAAAHDDLGAVAVREKIHLVDLMEGGEPLRTLSGPTSHITALAFSGNGEVLAAGDVAGDVYLWDVATGEPIGVVVGAHPERSAEGIELPPHQPGLAQFGVRALDVSHDASRVITGGLDVARVWEVSTGRLVREERIDRARLEPGRVAAPVEAVAFDDREGETFVVASSYSVLHFDASAVGDEFEFPGRVGAVSVEDDASVVLGSDTAVLYQRGGRITAVSLSNGSVVTFDAQLSGVPVIALDDEHGSVAVGGDDGTAVFSLDERPLIARSLPRNGHAELTFTEHGETVVLSSPDHRPIALYDLTGTEAIPLEVPDPGTSHFGWLGMTDGLVTWNIDTKVARIHPLGSTAAPAVELGATPVISTAGTPDRRLVAFGGQAAIDGAIVNVFDTSSGELVVRLDDLDPRDPASARGVMSLSFSPDGERLAAATTDGAAMVWRTSDWGIDAELSQGGGQVVIVEYSPDGRYLMTVAGNGTIVLRDPGHLQPLGDELHGVTSGLAGFTHGPAFSPDGRFMVTTADSSGRLWDVESRSQIGQAFPSDASSIPSVSGDAGYLGTFNGDRVLVWDLDVDGWYDIACRAAGRNLTLTEWNQFGPAGQPYAATCPIWPSDPAVVSEGTT